MPADEKARSPLDTGRDEPHGPSISGQANGDLSRYIIWSGKAKKAMLPALVGETPVERPPAGIDQEEWLRAKVPVLYGSNQDRPWIKYIIRDLVRAG